MLAELIRSKLRAERPAMRAAYKKEVRAAVKAFAVWERDGARAVKETDRQRLNWQLVEE